MRLHTTITPEMEAILNEQIAIEGNASAKYLAMASWANAKAFTHSYEFLVAQANEEREHMMKIFTFMIEAGANPISPAIEDHNKDYSTLRDVFQTALENEIYVTKSINKIMDLAHKHKDYVVSTFMQWFVTEQVEEEQTARRIMDMFELLGDTGLELMMADERIGQLKDK